jgi:Trehalose utilisation
MSNLSRRNFLGAALAAAALPKLALDAAAAPVPQAGRNGQRLRVQFTTGGHTAPLQLYAMFESPLFQDMQTRVLPHPHAFDDLSEIDVVVTNDWITDGWTQADRDFMVKFLDAGKGLVVLHHAVGTNNNQWPWFSENVTGVMLWNPDVPGMKTQARLKQFVRQTITPVGNHPIVRGMKPFVLPWDETFPNMWLAPKITPLVHSDDPDMVNPTVGWVGVHPKAKVSCLQPGHTRWVCEDPNYRHLVHNMILWGGGRLSS